MSPCPVCVSGPHCVACGSGPRRVGVRAGVRQRPDGTWLAFVDFGGTLFTRPCQSEDEARGVMAEALLALADRAARSAS